MVLEFLNILLKHSCSENNINEDGQRLGDYNEKKNNDCR